MMHSVFHNFQALAFMKDRPWYLTALMYVFVGMMWIEQFYKKMQSRVFVYKMRRTK